MAKGQLGYKVRTITCAGCGKEHTGHVRPAQRYCSLDCYRAAPHPQRRNGGTLKCAECGRDFYVPLGRLASARLCSRACLAAEQSRVRRDDDWFVANMRRAQQRQIRSLMPTRPERALYAILDALAVPYNRQHVIDRLFTVDAFIPSARLVVQADGDYWHGRHGATHPRVANRIRLDHAQGAYLRNRGVGVLRLWGSDLLRDGDGCRERIASALHDVPPAGA